MADRLKSLKRLEAVQKQMVRLSEMRLAAAERTCRELAEDKARLEAYLTHEGALGVPFAKAALKSLHMLDHRRAAAERARDAGRLVMETAKRREHAVGSLTEKAARAARRADEDRELALTIETWLATPRTSLR